MDTQERMTPQAKVVLKVAAALAVILFVIWLLM
jgi:flagellar biogenesis protein FliO